MAYRDIPAEVAVWAQRNENNIYNYYTRDGGWEGWAQNVLCDFLQDRYPDAAVQREQRVFEQVSEKGRKKKADLLVRPGTLDHYTIIELKCESVYQDASERGETDTIVSFVKRFEKDIVKIQGGILNEFRPCRAWAIGITRAHEVSKSPEDVQFHHDVSWRFVGNTDIIVWCWSQDFPKQG